MVRARTMRTDLGTCTYHSYSSRGMCTYLEQTRPKYVHVPYRPLNRPRYVHVPRTDQNRPRYVHVPYRPLNRPVCSVYSGMILKMMLLIRELSQKDFSVFACTQSSERT